MKSRPTYLITSIALHVALGVGLLLLASDRERGIGIDHTIVELTLIPGLEQLLEEATPTGSETTESVTPEPVPESTDTAPERVVERVDPDPALTEPVAEAPAPEPVTEPPAPAIDAPPSPLEPPAAAELASDTPPPSPSDAPANEPEAVETELEPTALAAIVVSVSPRRLPAPAIDLLPITTPMSASEQEVVEHHIDSWAQSFAALAEWQPSTTWVEDDRAYSATVTRLPAADNMGVEQAVVTVTTERDGQTFSTKMRMQRLGFSHFAQFIDRWDPQVQIHDDRIGGRFHSNSEILISNSRGIQPVFEGKVTTARGVDTSRSERRVRRDDVFRGGLETRVRRITLPRRVAIFDDDADAMPAERIQRFDADTRLTFHADGSFSRSGVDPETPPLRHELGAAPYYLIASEDVELRVSGIVNGKVLVYSPEDILIEGNLVYAADPTANPDSDDYLGLVSERSVEVADSRVTGPGDLSIHAAIYARGRFAVRGYHSRKSGTLFIHGSVTAGSLTATEPRFSTNLTFDERLDAVRPPSFPVTDRFEISEWNGHWTVAN